MFHQVVPDVWVWLGAPWWKESSLQPGQELRSELLWSPSKSSDIKKTAFQLISFKFLSF